MGKFLLFAVFVLSVLLTSGPTYAQIVRTIDADIPFALHAGLAKFPAGKYVFCIDGNSDLSIMEIRSDDGQHSALIAAHGAQATRTPRAAELIFNHLGDRHFLAEIFGDREKSGSADVDDGYPKRYGAGLEAGEQQHIPIDHSYS